MTRKLIFLFTFSLIFAVSAAFAQKADSFLGKWKQSGNESMTINVTENGEFLVVEKSGKSGANLDPYTTKTDFKINGNPITNVFGGSIGGYETRRLRFVKNNKLQFLTSTYYDHDHDLDRRLFRETWIVSEDGKTLTVKHEGKYAWSKLIFTKE